MMSSSPLTSVVDVFAVERRDERAVEPIQRLVGEIVGGVLFLADALDVVVDVGELLGQLPQVLGRRDRVAATAPRTGRRRPYPWAAD